MSKGAIINNLIHRLKIEFTVWQLKNCENLPTGYKLIDDFVHLVLSGENWP